MNIVGHRGAAGLLPENTLESIQKAVELGVNRVEFDVHLTKDSQLLAHHDSNLFRMTGKFAEISNRSLASIQHSFKAKGLRIPSLDEVLEFLEGFPAYIELKSENSADALIKVLKKHPKAKDIIVTSKLHGELIRLHALSPRLKLHAASYTRGLKTIRLARRMGWHGVTLPWWQLRPFNYVLCRRYGLNFMVFTVDRPFHIRLIKSQFPKVDLCTNRPDLALALTKSKSIQ